jgi:maltose-binding protein MalE
MKVFAEQLQEAKIAPPIPQWDAVAQELVRAVEQINLGGAPIDSTLSKLQDQTQSIVGRG